MEIVQSFEPEQMETMLRDLYCGMVCRKLKESGLYLFLDCEPYEFALSLDMSFEEILEIPLNEWESVVDSDLEEFAKDIR